MNERCEHGHPDGHCPHDGCAANHAAPEYMEARGKVATAVAVAARDPVVDKQRAMLMKYSRATLAEVMAHFPTWMVHRRILDSIERVNKLRKGRAALLAAMGELHRLEKKADRINQRVRGGVVCNRSDLKILRDCAAAGKKVDVLSNRLAKLMRAHGKPVARAGA